MKIIVYYSTITGNAEKLARDTYKYLEELGHEVSVYPTVTAEHTEPADIYILAFWCRRSSMDDNSLKLLEKLKNQYVLAIGTVGGDADGAYGRRVENNAENAVSKENICLGAKVCQGAVNLERVKRRMTLPPDDRHYVSREKYERFVKTQGHPNGADLEKMRNFVMQSLEKAGK